MSPEAIKRKPRPDIASGMTDMRLEALRLAALGKPRGQIAPQLQTTRHAVDQVMSNGYAALGVNGELHAILTLVEQGSFDLGELVGDFDLGKFALLRPLQHKILQTMIKDNGRNSGRKQIARELGYTYKSIVQRLTEIHRVIEEYSPTRTSLLYFVYQRQQEQHAVSENGGVVFSPASTVPRYVSVNIRHSTS